MGNIMVRMGVVIGVLFVVQGGFHLLGYWKHPDIVEPRQAIETFPLEVNSPTTGKWMGANTKLDERTWNESEVDLAVSRRYSKDGRSLNFLLAEYRQPDKGLYHNPMNCYHSNGFTLVGEAVREPLQAANRPDTKVSISTWVRKSEKVIVAYWYEVGDYTMYERQDLLKTQWAMFGKKKWPVMFKVLLEMPAGDGNQSQSRADILEMAQFTRQWLGDIQPMPE
jgi:EpsI family protein